MAPDAPCGMSRLCGERTLALLELILVDLAASKASVDLPGDRQEFGQLCQSSRKPPGVDPAIVPLHN